MGGGSHADEVAFKKGLGKPSWQIQVVLFVRPKKQTASSVSG